MEKATKLKLTIILTMTLVISFSILNNGHSWGDDFASYVMQSKSILDGTMEKFIEHNTFTITRSSSQLGPIAYPWGTPLILSPFYAMCGVNPICLKIPNLISYIAFLIVYFLLLRRYFTVTESLLAISLFSFNFTMLSFLNNIGSDIPFMFVSTTFIFLVNSYHDMNLQENSTLYYITVGVVCFIAFFIRTLGVLFLVSFLLYQVILFFQAKRSQDIVKGAIIPIFSFTVLVLIASLIFPDGQSSYFAQYAGFRQDTIGQNFIGYVRELVMFFPTVPISKPLYVFFVLFFTLGMWIQGKKDVFFVLFMGVYFGFLLTWPEWQGIRFIFPLLPLFFYFALQGWKIIFTLSKLDSKMPVLTILSIVSLFFLSNSLIAAYVSLRANREIDGPFDSYSMELYSFIKDESPSDSIIVFFKPRAMRLMTGRDSISSTDCDLMKVGNYIVINKAARDYLQIPQEKVGSCNLLLKLVFQNKMFIVYHRIE